MTPVATAHAVAAVRAGDNAHAVVDGAAAPEHVFSGRWRVVDAGSRGNRVSMLFTKTV